jgi:hypothetical protein
MRRSDGGKHGRGGEQKRPTTDELFAAIIAPAYTMPRSIERMYSSKGVRILILYDPDDESNGFVVVSS